jgi:hypothetical protein
MISTPFLTNNKFEYLKLPTQIDSFETFLGNSVLAHVAQTVAEKLQHTYSTQVNRSNYIQTIPIRALEPEYRHSFIEPLTAREFEVL